MDERNVKVNDLHKAALRTFMLDPDEWESKYAGALQNDDDLAGYPTLIGFTVGTAIRRHFPVTWSRSDLIRYVADVRINVGTEQLRPRLAEDLIRWILNDDSLGERPPFDGTPADIVSTSLILLMSLITDADLDEAGIDELINEAAHSAAQQRPETLPR
ncbi:hypothetical protein ABZ806_01370 [Spirillospora sp. NPDC047418]